jgi:hypothetical protein
MKRGVVLQGWHQPDAISADDGLADTLGVKLDNRLIRDFCWRLDHS